MKRVRVTLQLAALGGTGWLPLANSVAPDCTPTGPISFEVASTCGPPGTFRVTNDGVCQLTLEGTFPPAASKL